MELQERRIPWHERHLSWLLLSPTLLLLVVIGLLPFFYVLSLSFRDFFLLYPNIPRVLVGFKNFQYLMRDPVMWHSLGLTLIFTGLALLFEMLVGLGLALILSRRIKGVIFWRSLILIPMVVSPLVVGLIWLQMLNPDFGVVVWFLRKLGLFIRSGPTIERSTALLTCVFVDVWHWTPFVTLILTGGLLALPREPFEAAMIDGASRWQMFRKITLPLLKPILLVAFLLRTVDAFRIFDEIWVLTGGGPGDASRVIGIFAYRMSFFRWNLGYGSAIALFLLYLSILLCTVFYNLLRKR